MASSSAATRPCSITLYASTPTPVSRNTRHASVLTVNPHNERAIQGLAWLEECGKQVDVEINAYLESKVQPVEAIFDFLYADPPPDLLARVADSTNTRPA